MAEKISVALASAGNRLREGVDDTLRTPPPKVQRGISAEAALIPRAQKLRRTKTMLSSWGDVRTTYACRYTHSPICLHLYDVECDRSDSARLLSAPVLSRSPPSVSSRLFC